jgi:hypothetical protein
MSDLDTTIPFAPTRQRKISRSFVNLTGRIIHRWTVFSIHSPSNLTWRWLCRCRCGTWKVVSGKTLNQGTSHSCGCLATEKRRKRNTTHGQSRQGEFTPEFHVFHSAKDRCDNPNNPQYERYGGRGIQFRFASFVEFLNEVGPRPSSKHSLDRIKNDEHYEKGNLRWATPKEQSLNTRTVRLFTINGETDSLHGWCERYGKSDSIIRRRVDDYGWDILKALTAPPYARRDF